MDSHLSGKLRLLRCDNAFSHSTTNKAQDRRRVFLNSKFGFTAGAATYAADTELTSTHYIEGNNYSLTLAH